MICNVVPLAQGFKRIRSGVDSGAWYNEWFVRGSPHEMKNMVRVKIKGNANNSTDGSSGGEDDDNLDGDPPDFYAMASQPKPGNMKTAMKPCSSSKMEFKSGDQEAIPEHSYLHSNSILAPGMVSSLIYSFTSTTKTTKAHYMCRSNVILFIHAPALYL